MTATSTAPTRGPRHDGHGDSMSAEDLRKRGIVLLIGGVAIAVLVKPIGPLDHYWNPLLVGLAFTAAAAFTGRRSPLWGQASWSASGGCPR